MTDRITVPVADATAAQLREFAQTVLGIEVHRNDPSHSLTAKIRAAGYEKDTITVSPILASEARAVTLPAGQAKADAATDDDYVTVIIDKSQEKGGAEPVFVGVNGRGMLIARGKPQKIKRHYEEALSHATMTVYDQEERADGRPGDLIPREVPRFPYRVVA